MSSSRMALITFLLAVAGLTLPAGAGAAGLQTYVSGVGDDAYDCTTVMPCKTWAGAISKTTAGGTITALNSSGYGAVSITKSVTLDGAGYLSSSLAAFSNGIIVNGVGIDVVLKRLNIDSAGICTSATSAHGIRFLRGHSLTVQDVGIEGFGGSAISLEPTDGHGTVVVKDSVLVNNCTAGVDAASPAPTGDMTVRLEDDLIAGNATGVRAGAHAAVTLASNTIAFNTTMTTTAAGGTLSSLGDNRIGGVTGTLGSMPATPGPGPGPAPAPAVVPTPNSPAVPVVVPMPVVKKPAARCKVPKLTGLTLAAAKKALTRAHCKLGTVSYRIKKGRKRDRVYAQGLKAGSLRVANAKVSLSINGRAPRKAKHKAKASAVIGASTRAWVSVVGVDANPCSRTAPCRTFAKAVTVVAQNGIVNVVGNGDYGRVTIDHSLTIDGLGGDTAIDVATGNAITIAAAAGEAVTLSNLDLTGSCTAPGSGDGIILQSGGRLLVNNVTAHGFPGAGIALAPGAGGTAMIRGGALTGNCTAGLSNQRSGTTAIADGVLITGNATGVAVGDGALVQLARSNISANATGFAATGSGQIQGWPANALGPNGTAGFTPGTLPLS